MNPEKDRDGKIRFLDKLIGVTQFASGQQLAVRSAKIVSGSEAENTNALLQAMATVVHQGIDTPSAVRKTLQKYDGAAPAEQPAAQPSAPAPAAQPAAQPVAKQKEEDATMLQTEQDCIAGGDWQARYNPFLSWFLL
jgi:hypothetical protein